MAIEPITIDQEYTAATSRRVRGVSVRLAYTWGSVVARTRGSGGFDLDAFLLLAPAPTVLAATKTAKGKRERQQHVVPFSELPDSDGRMR